MTKLPDSSKYKGLTEAEAENRIANGDVNISSSSPSKSVKQIILTNVFTYFNLIFAIIAVALIAVGSSLLELTFILVIIVNSVIGIIQELRSKRTLHIM